MSRLVVLVADSNAEETVEELLSRSEALGIRSPACTVQTHPRHDPGVWNEGVEFLREVAKPDDHVLMLFDREGSGQENQTAEQIEDALESRLRQAGWADRAGAVVIDPELEVWVWSDSPQVGRALGMTEPEYQQLRSRNASGPTGKPRQPKELLRSTLRSNRLPRSPSIFRELARTVSFERCTDRAFLKLRTLLRQWFPAA